MGRQRGGEGDRGGEGASGGMTDETSGIAVDNKLSCTHRKRKILLVETRTNNWCSPQSRLKHPAEKKRREAPTSDVCESSEQRGKNCSLVAITRSQSTRDQWSDLSKVVSCWLFFYFVICKLSPQAESEACRQCITMHSVCGGGLWYWAAWPPMGGIRAMIKLYYTTKKKMAHTALRQVWEWRGKKKREAEGKILKNPVPYTPISHNIEGEVFCSYSGL